VVFGGLTSPARTAGGGFLGDGRQISRFGCACTPALRLRSGQSGRRLRRGCLLARLKPCPSGWWEMGGVMKMGGGGRPIRLRSGAMPTHGA
jgi:hypothetical protein